MSKNFELLRRARIEARPIEALSKPAPENYRTQAPGVESESESDWTRALAVLKKRWRVSALFAATVFSVVVLATLLMKPTYEPVATIEITPPGTEAFSMQGYSSSSTDSEYLETQAKNLQSDELALAVIRKLHLEENSDLMEHGTLSKVAGPVLSVLQRVHGALHKSKAAADEGGGTDAEQPANAPQVTAEENDALGAFEQRLTVKRDTSSRLTNVSFSAHDPKLAATVTNTLLQMFIEKTYKSKHDAVVQSTQWLSRQLEDVKTKMEESNRQLAEFQKQTGIADVDAGKSTFSEQISDQNKQLTQAQTDRIQLQSYLHGVKNGGPVALPQTGADPVVQQIAEKLAQAKADLAQVRAIYGAKNPNVVKMQNQVDVLEAQLEGQRKAILDQLNTSYAAAKAREQMMSGQIKSTNARLMDVAKYNTLKKEAEVNAELYNSLYAKVKEAGIAAEAKSSNAQIVTPALVLDSPTKPNWMMNLAGGLFVGLLGAVLIPFVWERFDRTVRSTDDVRKWTGLEMVAMVPLIRGNARRVRTMPGRDWSIRLLSGGVGAGEPAEKFLLERPQSPEAEAIRGLLTSVLISWPGKRRPQVLEVVSSLPGEGKTTIAVNLAIALSSYGTTCLVDADLRKPGISRAFNVMHDSGLGMVLEGTAQLDDSIVDTGVAKLSLLPGGPSPSNPAELIMSDSMSDVLRILRERFDFVVLDSPPLLPFADGRVLASLADGLILIGRSGQTPREAMRTSTDLLAKINSAPILEVVLNAIESDTSDYKYYYSA